MKITNNYARACDGFDKTPKAVYAALAFSLAVRLAGNDDTEDANRILLNEWRALHENGIVPQKPIVKTK